MKTFAEPPFHPGGLMVFDHSYSACCQDLNHARVLAFWATWLGGIPMASIAFVSWRRYRDRSLKPSAEPFLLAALVFQFASMLIALLLLSILLPDAGSEGLWPMLFLFFTAVTSGLAIPVWHHLRFRVAPTKPLLDFV